MDVLIKCLFIRVIPFIKKDQILAYKTNYVLTVYFSIKNLVSAQRIFINSLIYNLEFTSHYKIFLQEFAK